MDLTQLQQSFSDALLSPAAQPSFSSQLKSHALLDDRFAYYRGNLTGAWIASLRGAYPVLLQLVGDDFFDGMAKAYGAAYPSQSGDLTLSGAQLAAFLTHCDFIDTYPYFVDIARLEWSLHCAYYAADATPLSLNDAIVTAQTLGQDLVNGRLVFHPAASLFESDQSAVELWLAHQGDAEPVFPDEMTRKNAALITRPQWNASLVSLTGAEWSALDALFQGKSLGDALEIALSMDAHFDIPTALQRWFAAGAFTQMTFVD